MVDMGQADRSLRQIKGDVGVFQRHRERLAKLNTSKESSDWVEKTWTECQDKASKEAV